MAGEYLLTAYNDPSGLTVHRHQQGRHAGRTRQQPGPLDTGKFAHQIRVTPETSRSSW